MPESLSYTTYQQGTYLHHAMAAGKSKRTFEVILHYAIPIKEDPTEAWLADYPLEKRVSKEVAQLATEQVRQMDEQVNARLHIRDLLLARSVFLSETERLAKQLESHQRTFVLELDRTYAS